MWACVILCGRSHLFSEWTELLQGSTLVSRAVFFVLLVASKLNKGHGKSRSNNGQWFAYPSRLYAACVLSPAKVENLEDVRLFYLLFFESSIITTRCSGILWILKVFASETCISFISPRSLSPCLRCEHSLDPPYPLILFLCALPLCWHEAGKEPRSLRVCLFGLFLCLCVNFFFLHLNLNLTPLFILTREHACRHMHIDFSLYVLWDSHTIYPICSGKTLHYLFTFSTDRSLSMIREFFSAP